MVEEGERWWGWARRGGLGGSGCIREVGIGSIAWMGFQNALVGRVGFWYQGNHQEPPFFSLLSLMLISYPAYPYIKEKYCILLLSSRSEWGKPLNAENWWVYSGVHNVKSKDSYELTRDELAQSTIDTFPTGLTPWWKSWVTQKHIHVPITS